MISHNVCFTLIDDSPAAVQSLVDACRKYLATDHPGMVSFACGVLAADHVRHVNDREWHVGLHIVFEDKAAHDRYQSSATHRQFVTEAKPNWQRARVFDTVLA